LATHFRLYRVISAMQLGTDAKKPVPRADFLAERIPSDIFNLFVNSARKYAEIRSAPVDPAPLPAR
jgi:hypothetical protein